MGWREIREDENEEGEDGEGEGKRERRGQRNFSAGGLLLANGQIRKAHTVM